VKIVIVSDIHANYDAWRALPEDYDELWVLGDLVNYGPQPAEVLSEVMERASFVVQGNHDHAVGYEDDSLWGCVLVAAIPKNVYVFAKHIPRDNLVDGGERGVLRAHVARSGRSEPWNISDAPEPIHLRSTQGHYRRRDPISTIDGKWKVGQNRSAADQHGVEKGLREEGISEEMARLAVQRGARRPQ